MSGTVSPRNVLGIALLCCLVAAIFGAAPLAAWVDASSVIGGTVVQQAVDGWLELMQRVGLDQPYDAVRRAIRAAEGSN